jgi:hypothetical protein
MTDADRGTADRGTAAKWMRHAACAASCIGWWSTHMPPLSRSADLRPAPRARAEAANAARRQCGEAKPRGCAAPGV